jgi:hypothetical protein
VNGLTGSDDFELRQEGEKVDHHSITLQPLAAAIGTPPLPVGKLVGDFNVGTE